MESARDAFLAACASISGTITPIGFKYAKSGPHAVRRCSEFSYKIWFQSSERNVAGNHVALWIHAVVLSKRLLRWRASNPFAMHSGDYVAGGQIGNLVKNHSWRNWDVADPRARQAAVDDAAAAIRRIALPYFAQFDDIPALAAFLQDADIPSMEIDRAIDFLACYTDRAAASKAMQRFLAQRQDIRPQYFESLRRLRHEGISAVTGAGYAHQLALATVAYELTPPSD